MKYSARANTTPLPRDPLRTRDQTSERSCIKNVFGECLTLREAQEQDRRRGFVKGDGEFCSAGWISSRLIRFYGIKFSFAVFQCKKCDNRYFEDSICYWEAVLGTFREKKSIGNNYSSRVVLKYLIFEDLFYVIE